MSQICLINPILFESLGIETPPLPQRKYEGWRNFSIPTISYPPLSPDVSGIPKADREWVKGRCFAIYKQTNEINDQAVAEAAFEYIHAPLLPLATNLSSRYLDLYEAYVQYEISQGIPMIDIEGGQLKNHGFLSSEILAMQKDCQNLIDILTPLPPMREQEFDSFFRMLTSPEGREKLLASDAEDIFKNAAIQYNALKEKGLIDRACKATLVLSPVPKAYQYLRAIAQMRTNPRANGEERLLREISQRVNLEGGDLRQLSYSSGTNPLAYINLIKRGDPGHPIAEFRGKMFFIYINLHFANLFFKNPGLVQFTNEFLKKRGKGWQIDPEFAAEINRAEPKTVEPIFRYGGQLALNGHIRKRYVDRMYLQKNPNPTIHQIMRGDYKYSSKRFRHPLSARELLVQGGDFRLNAISPIQRLAMVSGAGFYAFNEPSQIDNSPQGQAAKKYLAMCEEYHLPKVAGISGTYERAALMGGLVGVTLSRDQLQDLKLALIAFMVPTQDHSVQEILQASKDFHLPYEPDQFDHDIYPPGGQQFQELIKKKVKQMGSYHPSYYLTADYANEIYGRNQVGHG